MSNDWFELGWIFGRYILFQSFTGTIVRWNRAMQRFCVYNSGEWGMGESALTALKLCSCILILESDNFIPIWLSFSPFPLFPFHINVHIFSRNTHFRRHQIKSTWQWNYFAFMLLFMMKRRSFGELALSVGFFGFFSYNMMYSLKKNRFSCNALTRLVIIESVSI